MAFINKSHNGLVTVVAIDGSRIKVASCVTLDLIR